MPRTTRCCFCHHIVVSLLMSAKTTTLSKGCKQSPDLCCFSNKPKNVIFRLVYLILEQAQTFTLRENFMSLRARNSFVVLDLQWPCQCAGHRSLHIGYEDLGKTILAACDFDICTCCMCVG